MRPVLPPRVLAQPLTALELHGYTQRVTGPKSAAEPYREVIQAAVARGLSAQRIWQDLREEYGFGHGFNH